jgi:hypothetical protein
MSILLSDKEEKEEKKKEKKKVSWGEQWLWKEGEEKQTRIKKINWKRKNKGRRDTITMERDEAEEREYYAKQVVWAFNILKHKLTARHIVYACTTSKTALLLLTHFLQTVGITLDKQELPQALVSFRNNPELTLEKIKKIEEAEDQLYLFYRVRVIRTEFVTPGQHISSTDTDESSRARDARLSLIGEEVVKNFDKLPAVLQALIAELANKGEDPLAAVRNNLQLQTTSTEDESTATLHPPTSPSDSDNSPGDKKRKSAKRTKTGTNHM